jgi:hypothetical protein
MEKGTPQYKASFLAIFKQIARGKPSAQAILVLMPVNG